MIEGRGWRGEGGRAAVGGGRGGVGFPEPLKREELLPPTKTMHGEGNPKDVDAIRKGFGWKLD